MSTLKIIILIYLLLMLSGCSIAATKEKKVQCENEYSKITEEVKTDILLNKHHEGLKERLARLISNCPKHIGLKILMADVEVSNGNNISALAYITKALEIDPSNAEAIHVKGSILFMEGQNKEAIKLLKKSTQLDPTNIEYLVNLCSTLEASGKYHEAVQSCTKGIRLSNDGVYPVLYFLRGKAYESMGNVQDSKKDYLKAKELGFDMK